MQDDNTIISNLANENELMLISISQLLEETEALYLENDKLKKNTALQLNNELKLNYFFNNSCLFVIGNGPSLNNDSLKLIHRESCIGMNLAFRHWERINWYPDYYICLDTVVTESQKDNILKLVEEQPQNGIRRFMLRKHILKHHPRLRQNPSVTIFDDYLQSPIFDQAQPLTTGSHAALFGAMLGFKKIYLLGIDCNYVQQLPEAENIRGSVLEMTKTPDKNPNYFFDDYQQRGDRFNIPDSKPDLHYRSWIMVKERLEKLGVDVVNCSPVSKLDMFDYVPLEKVMG